ncbi:antitoxin VapB family protein [Candidatus Woesearchaeota archaeon]|nr:antitoxin VapB family protein [Candidatus Woesearchaeota archaeon]
MATKTISITEEAYERLKAKKENNESFTDVINRVIGKRSLLELAGILSEEEADQLEKHIKERRAASRRRSDRIREMLR